MPDRGRLSRILRRRADDDHIVRRRLARKHASTRAGDSTVPAHRPDHAALLDRQRTHGNAHVARLLQRGEASGAAPRSGSLDEIGKRARAAEGDPRLTVVHAGLPLKQDPPGGMKFIAGQLKSGGLPRTPAGYTAIKSAAAFTAPGFVTRLAVEKDGYKRRYFTEVQPTTATDIEHAAYYPAPGIHENAVSVQKDATYHYFWEISAKISNLIRAGEQEHLDDARRAFELTYGLIAKEINAMVGTRFGPAESPAAAEQAAQTELAKRLPAALGTDPLTWFNVLDEMLGMTQKRDHDHLHDLIRGTPRQQGTTFYFPLVPTEQTSIDQVDSDQIVVYPTRKPAGGSGDQPSPPKSETVPAQDK